MDVYDGSAAAHNKAYNDNHYHDAETTRSRSVVSMNMNPFTLLRMNVAMLHWFLLIITARDAYASVRSRGNDGRNGLYKNPSLYI